MDLHWTNKALSDLLRLYDFLVNINTSAATRTVQTLVSAPSRLLTHPRMGESLEEFRPREVRRLLIADYEIPYEIQASSIYVLRIWHTRENR